MIPTNEQGVVALFSEYSGELGYTFKRVQAGCPDAIMEKDGHEVRIEFEFNALNFKKHGHNPADVDMIVCWNDDYPNSPVPILSLQMYLTLYRGMAPKEPVWLRFLNWLKAVRLAREKNKLDIYRICPCCGMVMIPVSDPEQYTESRDGEITKYGVTIWHCPSCKYRKSKWFQYDGGWE